MTRDARRPWGAVGLVAAALLLAAVVPVPGSAGAVVGSLRLDLLLHAVGYGLLAALLCRAFIATGLGILAAAGLAIGLAIGYGLALELVQFAIPSRGFSVADLAADAAGAVVGVIAWAARNRRTRG